MKIAGGQGPSRKMAFIEKNKEQTNIKMSYLRHMDSSLMTFGDNM